MTSYRLSIVTFAPERIVPQHICNTETDGRNTVAQRDRTVG